MYAFTWGWNRDHLVTSLKSRRIQDLDETQLMSTYSPRNVGGLYSMMLATMYDCLPYTFFCRFLKSLSLCLLREFKRKHFCHWPFYKAYGLAQ